MEFAYLLGVFSKSLLLVVAAILPIVNPPAMAPTFLIMTEDAPRARKALARRIGRNVALMLSGAMLVGTYVLEFFGISLSIVRVAGGLIVASYAWRLLTASTPASNDPRNKLADKLAAEHTVEPNADEMRIRAFYPMTFPISCGPGSIAASITVGASLHHPELSVSLVNFAGALAGATLIGLVVYLTYRFARKLLQPLGEAGIVVFLRLSAFILLCVGVQIMWDGTSTLLAGVLADSLWPASRP